VVAEERRGSLAYATLRALRPRHWIKNVFVLAPLVFAERLTDPRAAIHSACAFAVFCALSSSVYLWNDVADVERDRLHPTKRFRAIASGRVPIALAAWLGTFLGVASLVAAYLLSPAFAGVCAAYLGLNVAYSLGLKSVVILDVMIVATGFLLRAAGGALVLGVEMSHWLALCTGLLALFLGFVKRRQEIEGLEGPWSPTGQRPILREYSIPFLDQMISVVTASTVLAYALYALSPEVERKLGTRHLWITIPFVLFGIFRYLYLVHQKGEGDSPTELVSGDPPLLITVAAWVASVLVAIYLWP
jgi:4-hydroxybenzoate polyprenyltransferase